MPITFGVDIAAKIFATTIVCQKITFARVVLCGEIFRTLRQGRTTQRVEDTGHRRGELRKDREAFRSMYPSREGTLL